MSLINVALDLLRLVDSWRRRGGQSPAARSTAERVGDGFSATHQRQRFRSVACIGLLSTSGGHKPWIRPYTSGSVSVHFSPAGR